MTSGAGAVVSNLNLILTANTVFNIGAGGFTQNYFVSDGGGGFSLNKTGAGTLTLGAPNTYTGGTTVNSGTLALARGGGAGAIRGVVTVNSGATLNLTVNNALGYNAGQQVTTLNINGGTVSVTGNQGDEGYLTSFNLTGSTLAYASTNGSAYQISAGDATAPGITSNASATTSVISGGVEIRSGNLGFNVASGTTASGVDLLVSGAITVPGNTTYGITKTGTGVMVLSGANTYTGNVLINGGTLAVGHFGADNGTNGAVGNATVAGRTVTVNSGATLNGTAQNWFGNASNADANLPAIIVNGGTLSTSRYTTIGSLTLNGATVTNSATNSGNYQGFALRGGVTVVTAASTISAAAATATTQGYHLGANTLFTVASTGATGADLTVSAPLRNQSGDFGSAAGGFTKSGAGTMLLSGANTYTGATTVIQGTLTVAGTGAALGTGALAVNNANTGAGTNVIVNFNTNSNQTVNGLSSTITKPTSGTNTAQVNIASGSTLTDTQSGTTSYAGSVSGGGTLAIGGQNSAAPATVNYTGTDTAAQTNVNANATLQLNNAAGPALSSPVAVATSGTVLLGGNNQIATTAPGTASPTNVALNGGTLNANGHSDGVTNGSADPTQAAVTSSMGTLSLASGASTLDFGSGSTNDIIAFADSLSSLQSGTGTLNIINYTGGTDALYIGTTQDLTKAELSRITFGGNIAAIQFSNGLVAAPEPSQYASFAVGLLGLGALVLRARKRKAAAAQAA